MREWLIRQRGTLRQADVARLAGMSRGGYANIESGKRDPSVKLAKRIAMALGFDWRLFFGLDAVEVKQKEGVEIDDQSKVS